MALLDCAINKKCCTVDGGRGIGPLFSSPPRRICQLKSPKRAWAQVELTDALHIDKTIKLKNKHNNFFIMLELNLSMFVQTLAARTAKVRTGWQYM